MLVNLPPKDQTEVVVTSHVCPFHKKHPGKNWAGCTCSGSYVLKRKGNKGKGNSSE